MEAKWIAIGFSVFLIASFGAIGVDSYSENISNIEIAKSGMEQCPRFGAGHGGEIIWVKSCTAYTESIKD